MGAILFTRNSFLWCSLEGFENVRKTYIFVGNKAKLTALIGVSGCNNVVMSGANLFTL